MCLAIPAKVISISGREATVEISGNRRPADITLVDGAEPGKWVLIHAGIALQVLDEDEALETLELIQEAYGNG